MVDARDERVTLLSVKEYAQAWGVHEKTVLRWIREGRIEAARHTEKGPWRIRVPRPSPRSA